MVLLLAGQRVTDLDLPGLLNHPLLLQSCQAFLGQVSPAAVSAAQKSVHVIQGEAAIVDLHAVRPSCLSRAFSTLSQPPTCM